MIIKSNDILLQLTTKKKDYYSLKKRIEKEKFFELRYIKSDVRLSTQNLIFSFLNFLIRDNHIPDSIGIPNSVGNSTKLEYLKQYLSKKYFLGEEKEYKYTIKQNNTIIEKKELVFNFFSWSYLKSTREEYAKIYRAISDFSNNIGVPIELFLSNEKVYGDSNIDKMKSYLLYINNNTCIATNKNIDTKKDRVDLHHTYIHQTEKNNEKFPLFMHSVFNLSAISHTFHINNNSWKDNAFELNNKDIEYIEYMLNEFNGLKNWAIEPYKYENIKYIQEFLKEEYREEKERKLQDLISYNCFF